MPGLLDCAVKIDGVTYNDGCQAPDTEPTLVSGLRVTWGRATNIDQPEPSTCVFSLLDPTQGANSLGALKVGAPVIVEASGTVYGAPSGGTFDDPYLAGLDGISGVNYTKALDPDGALVAKRNAGGWFANFTPRALFADWSDIPQSAPGQTWQIQVTLTLPYAASVSLYPLWFSGSDDTHPLNGGTLTSIAGPPYGEITLSYNVTAPDSAPGYWLGFRLRVTTGDTWAEINPADTWGSLAGTYQAGPSPWTSEFDGSFGAESLVPSNDAPRWAALLVSHAETITPAAGAARLVRVFSGYVTDIEGAWVNGQGLGVRVTAADFTANLANRVIGAAVWNEQTISARAAAILTAAGDGTPIAVDTLPGSYSVCRRDIDAQSPLALLKDLASSGDAVLWPRWSIAQGDNFWMEDISQRGSSSTLVDSGGTVVIQTTDPTNIGDALELGSCDVLLSPLVWRQESSDVLTRVGVTWQEQGTDTSGNPTLTEHTNWAIDSGSEATYGVRTMSISTDLAYSTDAQSIADRVASRAFGLTWRMEGLTVDADAMESPDATATELLAQLLDMQTRTGAMVWVRDMPTWAPAVQPGDRAVFLEGGTYEFTNGTWLLSLVTSDAYGSGISAPWSALNPAWAWSEFDATITFAAMRGTGV